jgi:two-component system sensor histidine kinase GlrK
MKISIFPRLLMSYLVIFLLVAALSVYAVMKLHRVNNITHEILTGDTIVLDDEKMLNSALISQIRYERKYLIMRDVIFYNQFLEAKKDFAFYLDKVLSEADNPVKRGFAHRIKDYHDLYQSLFESETGFINNNRSYPQALYREKKQEALDATLDEVKKMRLYYQQDIHDKLRALQTAGDDAAKTIAMMSAAAISLGIVISLFSTRSITRPLRAVIDKTREIANGVLKSDLDISSPAEIGELARAFNLMCSKLQAVDKMKSDFFSAMSHELRTPLTSIKEGTSLLLEGVGGDTTEKQRKLLTIIAEESNRLITQVNSLLDLSKMEEGMVHFNFAQGDIIPLLRKAAAETELLAAAKNMTLQLAHAPELPPIRMDSERMLQVLRNLIGNAVKFTPHGGRVKVSAGSVAEGLMVVVSDTGPSIPKEKLSVIFEKYHQIPLADSNQIKGTGLGLAIVKHIITAHGGRVWAESEKGRGSSFIFVLPA